MRMRSFPVPVLKRATLVANIFTRTEHLNLFACQISCFFFKASATDPHASSWLVPQILRPLHPRHPTINSRIMPSIQDSNHASCQASGATKPVQADFLQNTRAPCQRRNALSGGAGKMLWGPHGTLISYHPFCRLSGYQAGRQWDM